MATRTPVPAGDLNVGQTARIDNHGHVYIGSVKFTTADMARENGGDRFTLMLDWTDYNNGSECSVQLSCRLDDYAELIQ